MSLPRTLLWLALACALAAACSARRGEPLAGPLEFDSAAEERGRLVFYSHCHQCHPGGEAGVGPALNTGTMPDFVRRYQVRNGYGRMPAFERSELTDRQLRDLMSYLSALRRRDGGSAPARRQGGLQ